MNPSTAGWIEKFCSQISKKGIPFENYHTMYSSLKSYGFIYGVNISMTDKVDGTLTYSEDELAKTNLITGLYHVYYFHKGEVTTKAFIEILLDFYKSLEVSDLSLWDKLVIGKSETSMLERLIHDRVQIDDNIITRSFNKSITNSLLFVDVLAFDSYLSTSIEPKSYTAHLESIIIGTLYKSLNSKSKITDYDKEIIDVIETSSSLPDLDVDIEDLIYDIDYNINTNEKKYLIDLMCLSIWDDEILEKSEYQFLVQLAKRLNIEVSVIQDSILCVFNFHTTHQKEVLLFQQKNPISNFYENSSQLVTKLIRRNSKRIVKEIRQSKELMLLITKSTHSDLSKEEQKKLQAQLVDVLKTIPSLAIFLLPGGAILLPIFAKLIPNLLPSSFDDNRIEK
ncbi:LETM1-related biofilm-associated protein [Psychroserpens ponticola]|uniref:LETM1-related biofilm-associated protein n=1 Tax=Psychroserpens ponticola TaxID=2932268 RepID=A0ABY7RUB3_9FLAO|nr:LETM1-related biofilm-associated protein [Psychroserpens ponticola]WCO00719.1 LETM1-related biofilm-associated protein [Psychroserpens ponticola]